MTNEIQTIKTIDGPVLVKVGETSISFKDGHEQYGRLVAIKGATLTLSVYDAVTGERENMAINASRCWVEQPYVEKEETMNEVETVLDTLTAKEKVVAEAMRAFFNYDNADAEKSDCAGWFDVKEMANEVGYTQGSVRGIIGSLVKKGLIHNDEGEGGKKIQCATDLGIDVAFALKGAPKVEARKQADAEGDNDAAKAQADDAANNPEFAVDTTDWNLTITQAKSLCVALRALAVEWDGTRKEFIAEAAKYEIHPSTAATQFYKGRKGIK